MATMERRQPKRQNAKFSGHFAPSISNGYSSFLNFSIYKKYPPFGGKYKIFLRSDYLLREANSFPGTRLKKKVLYNRELRGKDSMQGQIYENILAPNYGVSRS